MTALESPFGAIPYRLALAGGWIDQPFVSRWNPEPPGAMVVVSLKPDAWYMERAGIATGTRNVALRIWGDRLPQRPAAELVRELYEAENRDRAEPSGSQDMIGMIYPGISRLDYDYGAHGGVYPAHIESSLDPALAAWLESVLHLVPVQQRLPGYNPLGVKNLDGAVIRELGRTGHDCYAAILARDVAALGDAMSRCMRCWEVMLPDTFHHPSIQVNLLAILDHYQRVSAGAAYSGCGGGYVIVASDTPLPGALKIRVRLA